MSGEKLQKYKPMILISTIVCLIILSVAVGFTWGKIKICKQSGGVLAEVPNEGEQCVQNFIESNDCMLPLTSNDLSLTAEFCKDQTGLYPISVIFE